MKCWKASELLIVALSKDVNARARVNRHRQRLVVEKDGRSRESVGEMKCLNVEAFLRAIAFGV